MKNEENNLPTPIKAIRLKCLDCSGGSSTEVDKCVIPDCALFPYRYGKRPSTLKAKAEGKKVRNRPPMTEEHKEKLRLGRLKKKQEQENG